MSHSRTFIIAEAGVNHNGSLDMALELVTAAKAAGADAVKFQTFDADKLATQSAELAPYQKAAADAAKTQHEMLKKLQLTVDEFREIKSHCEEQRIQFLSSPFDNAAAEDLYSLGLRLFKIPSGEITNIPLLEFVGSKNCDVILSTGMSWLGEIEFAILSLQRSGAKSLTLLHCVTEYPAPAEQINLRAMVTLRNSFGLPVGYSDHSKGTEIAVAAVALGATVIEKHFTLDTELPGPDHSASLSPDTFKGMVGAIRNVELALGDGTKKPAPCEIPNMDVARKSIVAARNLNEGQLLKESDLAIKRPGSGIAPKHLGALVGRRVRQNIQADTLVDWGDLL